MQTHAEGETSTKAHVIRERRSALRRITPEQLLHLGAAYVAYLKAGICDGKELFAVYRADGILVIVTDSFEAAVETAAEQGLNFVAVH